MINFADPSHYVSNMNSGGSVASYFGVPDMINTSYWSDKYGSNPLTNLLDKTGSWMNSINPSTLGAQNALISSSIDSRNAAQQFERQMELQNDQQAFNAEEARIARDWTERLANTAYQRSAADLKAAGLNPWLAVQNPASSAGGVAASSTQGQASRAENTTTSALNTGLQVIGSIISAAISAIAKLGSSAASAAG